jgi:serine phosphatase RsbU (regulator of sigma subunit)
MVNLVIFKGPHTGRRFTVQPGATIIGRQPGCGVCLDSPSVSREHARVVCEGGRYFVEDLKSSNGTFLNGKRLRERAPLTADDTLQIGPYSFFLRPTYTPAPREENMVVRAEVPADPGHVTLHGGDSRQKLQVVLEIAQQLSRTLDADHLLGKVLDQLMRLFPQADRGLVVLVEGDDFRVAARRGRWPSFMPNPPYSRTVVRKALEDGVGILSEDLHIDQRFQASTTISSLNVRSLICVPLIALGGRRLGVLQLDCHQTGKKFESEDLQLATAVGLQVAVVLDNAALHAELVREERLRQEVQLAREIQQGFLPTNFPDPSQCGYELYARLKTAHEVSGDSYDFFTLKDGRLAFFVGDVSGKGVPAALFLVAVRTLGRHLAAAGDSPSSTLDRLNTALAEDNASGIFVTLLHGIYEPATGDVVVASAGHPLPLLRRADGSVAEADMPSGRIVGFQVGDMRLEDRRFRMAPGDALIAYTDGITEARTPDQQTMFGRERLVETVGAARAQESLELCANAVHSAVEQFTGSSELQDDQTLLLLRRAAGG